MAQSVWTGGSHHTGLAALPHENIQYSRNTGKVWLVDSKREVIDELDLRCSNLRHMLVDNKNENILYELYQQNGSCKVYYQPIGEIDILSSYSLR